MRDFYGNTTERIEMRNWLLADADSLFKYASDHRVSKLALWPCHTSVEMSREVIEQFFIPNPHNFAMVLKATDEPVGCIGLVPSGEEHHSVLPDEREVGYWIGYPYWGQGLTTEALFWLIDYCRKDLNLKSLMLTTDSLNHGSRRVAEKCGFQRIEVYEYDGIASVLYRLDLSD